MSGPRSPERHCRHRRSSAVRNLPARGGATSPPWPELQDKEQMERSIAGHETLRRTQWRSRPLHCLELVSGNHLGLASCATAPNRSDIWTQASQRRREWEQVSDKTTLDQEDGQSRRLHPKPPRPASGFAISKKLWHRTARESLDRPAPKLCRHHDGGLVLCAAGGVARVGVDADGTWHEHGQGHAMLPQATAAGLQQILPNHDLLCRDGPS